MSLSPGYLVIGVWANTAQNGPAYIPAGTLVTDPTVLAAVASAGGQTLPQTNAFAAAAATIAQNARSKGANEIALNDIMQAAVAAIAAAVQFYGTGNAAANGSTIIQPAPIGQGATVLSGGLSVMFSGSAAAGESAVLQLRKNGTNISGATITYNNTQNPRTALVFPNTAGIVLVATDVLDVVDTYTAGGGPTLTGTTYTVMGAAA